MISRNPNRPCVCACVCVCQQVSQASMFVFTCGAVGILFSLFLFWNVSLVSLQSQPGVCSVLQCVPLSSHNLVCVRLSPPSSMYVCICLRPCACVRLFLVPLCCIFQPGIYMFVSISVVVCVFVVWNGFSVCHCCVSVCVCFSLSSLRASIHICTYIIVITITLSSFKDLQTFSKRHIKETCVFEKRPMRTSSMQKKRTAFVKREVSTKIRGYHVSLSVCCPLSVLGGDPLHIFKYIYLYQ